MKNPFAPYKSFEEMHQAAEAGRPGKIIQPVPGIIKRPSKKKKKN